VFNAVGNQVCYSLMSQYTPRVRQTGTLLAPQADTPRVSQVDTARASQSPELQRTVTEEEYSELVDFALDLGITNSFMQEGSAAAESFIPPFDLTGV
jgi:putative pyruvate formate lyase activating enzyme